MDDGSERRVPGSGASRVLGRVIKGDAGESLNEKPILPPPRRAQVVNAEEFEAKTVGKQIIAEGIETTDQAWMLQMTGCALGQGYYFGRPLDPRAFAARLAIAQPRLAATA